MLSTDERDLLHQWPHIIDIVIADPSYGARHLRELGGSGGGWGRNFKLTKTALVGTWHDCEIIEWFSKGPHKGEPARLQIDDDPFRTVTMSYRRLQAWSEQLPAELRDRARRVYQRDPRALRAISLEAINLDIQLDLFGDTA